MYFRKNILIYTIGSLLILVALASFYRFMVQGDYIVSYEGSCDPATESCFIECEDEECSAEYYTTKVYRPRAELFEICGTHGLMDGCEAADTCENASDECRVVYCDPVVDGDSCETITDNL